MKFIYDHDLHIHSQLSSCSQHPEQTAEGLLKYAKSNRLNTICVTDHFWSERVEGASNWYSSQNLAHISKILPLPKDDEVRFLFGCETELNKDGILGIAKEDYNKFDIIIVPTTHFHMTDFTLSLAELESPKTRAQAWIDRIDKVLDMDLPFNKVGFAHLTTGLIYKGEVDKLLETFSLIPTDEMARLFTKAAKLGAGIELNSGSMKNAAINKDLFRPYIVAKECGCKFYVGSDSHRPEGFEGVAEATDFAVDYLQLDETDKFKI